MKHIKFRAWHPARNMFTHNSNYSCDIAIMGDGSLLEWTSWHDSKGLQRGYRPTRKKIVIQQFTGLQDKNGTDIYEGDIVRILPSREKIYPTNLMDISPEEWYGGFRGMTGVVAWVDFLGQYWVWLYWDEGKLESHQEFLELRDTGQSHNENNILADEIIVIGNKFENPELVGDEDEL